jgi:ATP-dependent protease HslVU (ClpYQ) peptidase subunit
MTTKPEAIRLADELADYSEGPYTAVVLEQAAAELRRLYAENEDLRRCAEVEEVEKYAAANRRLHALNEELLAIAHQYASDLRYPPIGDSRVRRLEAVLAVIKKAEGA